MKELSIEEKAKRYDDLLVKLQEAKVDYDVCDERYCCVIDNIVPELKESEDERIRKDIIVLIKDWWDRVNKDNISTKEQMLAWLEKQGEQKPADKVEPKFHEGDIIIHKELGGDYIHNPHKIIQVDILDKKYRLEGGLVAHFDEQDDYELVEQKSAWSEEDEKCLENAIDIIEWYSVVDKSKSRRVSDWLKCLKERYTWKPSDEQMNVLDEVKRNPHLSTAEYSGLIGLMEQLKKLRKE